MLRFQAESVVPTVGASGGILEGAIKVIAGVELHAGLGGVDLQDAATCGVGDNGRGLGQGVRRIQNPIVVITYAKLQLLVVRADPGVDRRGLAEVERRSGYGSELPGGDHAGVNRRVAVGVDLDYIL